MTLCAKLYQLGRISISDMDLAKSGSLSLAISPNDLVFYIPGVRTNLHDIV